MRPIPIAGTLVLGLTMLAACQDNPLSIGASPVDGVTLSVMADQLGGGNASGHADIQGTTFQGDFVVETYSFAAVSTGPSPLAQGQVQADILFRGQRIMVHAEVTCLAIVDDQAWVGSRVTRFVVDGQSQPVGGPMVFRVRDMGEGHGAIDLAALLFFGFASDLAYCNERPAFPILRENMNGNVQVGEG